MSPRTSLPVVAAGLLLWQMPNRAHAVQPAEGEATGTADGREDATAGAGPVDAEDAGVGAAPVGSREAPTRSAPAASGGARAARGALYRPQGKYRVHLDVDFLIQPRPNDYQEPPETTQVLRPMLGIGFGHGVHRHLVVGARLAFNFHRSRDRTEDVLENDIVSVTRGTAGAFLPYLEVLPLPAGRILPFISMRAGFAWEVATTRVKGGPPGAMVDLGARASWIGPTVGLGAGAHFFLTPACSLDIAALFDTRWLFARGRELGAGAPDPEPWKASQTLMNLGLGLGLSAWF